MRHPRRAASASISVSKSKLVLSVASNSAASDAVEHAEAALRIRHALADDAADGPAHVAVRAFAHEGHVAHVAHAVADDHRGAGGIGLGEEVRDFVGQMLTVAVEDEDEVHTRPFQEGTQAGFDRGAFAGVLFVLDDFDAGGARLVARAIRRAVIDDEDEIELRPLPRWPRRGFAFPRNSTG